MPRKQQTKKQEPLREAKVVDTEEFENNSDVPYVGDDTMMLPNEGESMTPEQDEETQQELDEDQAMFNGDPALVEAVFEWMDNEIKDCDSVEAAKNLAVQEHVSIEVAIEALNLCRKVFTAKRVSFQNIYDTLKEEK